MDDAQTWFREGVTLYEKSDYRRAITAFDKAIASDPTLAEAWNNRGLSLIQTGDYEEARRSIQKALSINPRYENAKKARNIVLGLLKDQEKTAPAPTSPGVSPQVPVVPGRKRSVILIALFVVILVAAGGITAVRHMQGPGFFSWGTPTPVPTAIPTTVATTVATLTPEPTSIKPVIPSSGVWVEINYTRYFSGNVGIPGNLQMLSGTLQMQPNTGDQFYQIAQNNGIISASVAKNDGSGDPLTVNIYKDGTLLKTGSTRVPFGSLDVVTVLPSPTVQSSAGNATENETVAVPAASGT
jgi:tetratricopeptide (TPR) repeat protein